MRAGDLYSGCGGLSAGLAQAGMDLAFAAELWESAARVYEQNFDHDVARLNLGDMLKAVRALKAAKVDIIAGGPPCQEFSQAGKRKESDRAHLTLVFGEVVRAVRPLWFIMENVPEARGSKAWQAARHLLKDAGYGISEVTLNSAFYGVPQFRKRFLALGRLDVQDGFVDVALHEHVNEFPMSVREFVGAEFEIDFYYRHPRNWGRRAVFSIDEPSPTVRSTNRPVPPGYTAHPLDPAPHADVRPLTPHERARIQTFPKKHRFEGITSHLDTMIANAVPVRLAEHVGTVIKRYEEGFRLGPEDEFRAWLRNQHDYTPRAAGDVLSRLRRAKRFLGEGDNHFRAPQEEIRRLRSIAEFSALPASVKSQIKRAIELQEEFRASARN